MKRNQFFLSVLLFGLVTLSCAQRAVFFAQNEPVLPIPPASAVVFNNLQAVGGWTPCNGTTCTGGSNTGSQVITPSVASPSLSGGSLQVTCNGNDFNCLTYLHVSCTSLPGGVCSGIANFLEDSWFYIPSATNHLQALEFDPDAYSSASQWFISMQCDSVSSNWRFWNFGASPSPTWVERTIHYPCPVLTQTGFWHHYQQYSTINFGGGNNAYQTLVIDGNVVYHGINAVYVNFTCPSCTDTLNIEMQIDNNSSATTNIVYYDQIKLTVW